MLAFITMIITALAAQPAGKPPETATPLPRSADASRPSSNQQADQDALIAPGAATFDINAAPQLEVKRSRTGQLLVRPRVNGKDTGWFIFDTGAGICVVSTPHLGTLALTEAGTVEAVGVGGTTSTQVYHAGSLVLGPMTLSDHPVITADLSFLKQHLGDEIVGVIGYGVLSRSVAVMDLKHAKIALHDPATYRLPQNAAWSPLSVHERTATVHARFDGGEGDFGLDTGANGFVTFHEPTTREKKLLDGRATTDARLGGVGGFVKAKRGTLGWFELGGVRRENIEATFAIEAKGTFASAAKAGNIGAAMLDPFVLVFDYTNQRVAFVPREHAPGTAASTPPAR